MISEERLCQAAREASKAYLASLPEPEECHHTFSPAFERRMKRLLRREKHKALYPSLRRIAGFLLVLVLCGGVFLSTNAQAREAAFGWISEQVERIRRYFYQGGVTPSSEIVHYQIDIPEGYWLEDSLESGGLFDYFYANETNDYISLTYQYETENSGGSMGIDGRQAEEKRITIHGNPAYLYIAYDKDASNTVVWTDQETGALIDVTAFMDEEALIELAESVVPVEK